ncbi:hypothetical protein RJ639_022933, partial [Escallonia herrerae]
MGASFLPLVDPKLKTSTSPMGDIVRCIHIAMLCVQEDAADIPPCPAPSPHPTPPKIEASSKFLVADWSSANEKRRQKCGGEELSKYKEISSGES